jgi:hypothetical protein
MLRRCPSWPQVTRRTIRSPWSTGIPEYVWRHQANIAAHNVTRQLPTRRATQVLRTGTESAPGQSRHFDPLPATSGPPPITDIAPTPGIKRIETTAASETAPYGRSAKSQAPAYSRVLACASLRHHSATAKQYCPSSSTVARQFPPALNKAGTKD